MNFDLNVSIPALTVFLQGLLSFFSPCVLPLLPVYVGYLSGGTAARDADGKLRYNRAKVAVNTLFFVLGISFTFFLLALGMTAFGRAIGSGRRIFSIIGGVLIILFGLYQLGVFGGITVIERERRLPFAVTKMAMSPLTALLMGFTFSFAWTPCVGPALSSVLLMASASQTSAKGFLLIGLYTIGFVIPFLAVGLFAASLLELFKKHRNVLKYTVKVGGVIMILMGVMMITGLMDDFTGFFARLAS